MHPCFSVIAERDPINEDRLDVHMYIDINRRCFMAALPLIPVEFRLKLTKRISVGSSRNFGYSLKSRDACILIAIN